MPVLPIASSIDARRLGRRAFRGVPRLRRVRAWPGAERRGSAAMRCSSASSVVWSSGDGFARRRAARRQASASARSTGSRSGRARQPAQQRRGRRVAVRGDDAARTTARQSSCTYSMPVVAARDRRAAHGRARASSRSPRRTAMRTSWIRAVASTSRLATRRAPRRAAAGRRARPRRVAAEAVDGGEVHEQRAAAAGEAVRVATRERPRRGRRAPSAIRRAPGRAQARLFSRHRDAAASRPVRVARQHVAHQRAARA